MHGEKGSQEEGREEENGQTKGRQKDCTYPHCIWKGRCETACKTPREKEAGTKEAGQKKNGQKESLAQTSQHVAGIKEIIAELKAITEEVRQQHGETLQYLADITEEIKAIRRER